VIASGLAVGTVLTFHTRSSLVSLGAAAEIPTIQAMAFFVEIGPLVTALLVASVQGSARFWRT
jgi:phospholipid/cholesterol/gamma-HCH transport system permease protein